MQVIRYDKGSVMGISLVGELDHHAAKKAMSEIDKLFDLFLPVDMELDLSGLTFMDSSGIALILNAYRRSGELGGRLRVCGVPAQAARVIEAAGINRLVEIVPQAEREVF